MRTPFATTIEEGLIKKFKLRAIENDLNMNDILEKLIEMYLNGKIKIDFKQN